MDVYILTGQSNSLGTTELEGADHSPGSSATDATSKFFWSNADGSYAQYPSVLHGDSDGVITTLQMQQGDSNNATFWGPEFGLARTLAAAGQANVLIIKASRGGGGNTFWEKTAFETNPNSGHMWGHVRDTVAAALTAATVAGHNVQVKGLMYLQGESNDTTEAGAADVRLSNLTANLREYINSNFGNAAANMKTVVGEIAASASNPNRITTTALQRSLADSRCDMTFVQTHDQPLKSDGLHFGAGSKLMIGERFAHALLDLQTRPASVLARYQADLAAATPVSHPSTQGWTETGGAANVTLQGVTENGTRGWQVLDNSTASNPGYYQPLTAGDYQAMFDKGWRFTAKVKVDGGGGLALWSVTSGRAPAGWATAAGVGNMNGFVIDRVNGNEFQVRLFETPNGPTVNRGPGSADEFHTLELVGHAGSGIFDFLVDGEKYFSSSISAGGGVAGFENRALFNSGSTPDIGRSVIWHEVSLQTIPEPGSAALFTTRVLALW
jgi:hypothetical protein